MAGIGDLGTFSEGWSNGVPMDSPEMNLMTALQGNGLLRGQLKRRRRMTNGVWGGYSGVSQLGGGRGRANVEEDCETRKQWPPVRELQLGFAE